MSAFCTLFDSRYFSRGIAMCESLLRHMPQARIYVYAMDEVCRDACRAWAVPGVQVVPLETLEEDDPELRGMRPARSALEYCWTSTPCAIRHVLGRFGEQTCTYVDADAYFYASPQILLAELGEDSVMITEHRFSPGHDQTASSGVYNVQFIPFRADAPGKAILQWWRAACLESCELDPAEGKCGDQKYLDDWTTRFAGVHVMRHLGGGVAPWNVQQYRFRAVAPGVIEGTTGDGRRFQLIFYHFHAFKMTSRQNVHLTSLGYPLGADVVDLLYRPYVRHLLEIEGRLQELGMGFDPHGRHYEPPDTLRARLRRLKRRALSPWSNDPTTPGNANRVYHASEL